MHVRVIQRMQNFSLPIWYNCRNKKFGIPLPWERSAKDKIVTHAVTRESGDYHFPSGMQEVTVCGTK